MKFKKQQKLSVFKFWQSWFKWSVHLNGKKHFLTYLHVSNNAMLLVAVGSFELGSMLMLTKTLKGFQIKTRTPTRWWCWSNRDIVQFLKVFFQCHAPQTNIHSFPMKSQKLKHGHITWEENIFCLVIWVNSLFKLKHILPLSGYTESPISSPWLCWIKASLSSS